MNKRTIFALSSAFVLALGLLSYPTSSIAMGTAEERAACMPEAFRLCSPYIPNAGKVIACLKEKKAELNPGCRKAVDTHSTETAGRTRSMSTEVADWCNFRRVAMDSTQQTWLNWCGSAANK